MTAKRDIFIVGARRCAFGAFGGTLKNHSATDLAEIVAKSALEASSLGPDSVDHIIFGNVFSGPLLASHVGVRMGLRKQQIATYGVNRLCGSGIESIVQGVQQILLERANIVFSGGTESLSQVPFVRSRFDTLHTANDELTDMLMTNFHDPILGNPEILGQMYNVSRAECDEYARKAHERWEKANNAQLFKAEIEPLLLKKTRVIGGAETATEEEEAVFETDELARGTMKLHPLKQENGLNTSGNSSAFADGAACVVLCSAEAVEKHKLQPLCRVVDWHTVGCDPAITGIGQIEAIRGLCERARISLDQVDLFEINEAYASHVLAVQKALGIDPGRVNVHGGAICMGNPFAASATRMIVHLAHEINRCRDIKYAIAAVSIGAGQGSAILLEKLSKEIGEEGEEAKKKNRQRSML